jgi:hypothetical protein
MKALLVCGVVGLLTVGAGSTARAQSADSGLDSATVARVMGAYELSMVNGKKVPANAWKRESADTSCTTVSNGGSFLFDSYGRWAAMTTERDRCFTTAGKRHIRPDVSTVAAGRYTLRGDTIELSDEFHPGMTVTGTIGANKTIMLDVPGMADSEGQHAQYTLKQVREVRP